jgi:hypothetical protein
MSIISEAIRAKQSSDPRHTMGATPNVSISPSSINVTDRVQAYFKERANKFRKTPPSDSSIAGQFAGIIASRLKVYFESVLEHPDMGSPKDWSINQVKVDYIDDKFVYACIIENKVENSRWLVFFDQPEKYGDRIAPRYVNLETMFFDLDNFPMSIVSNSPQEAQNTAIEMSKKKLEDSIKNAKELEDMF